MNADRWHLMVHQLCGMPLPVVPAIPGRVFKAPDSPDEDPGPPEIEHAPPRRDLANALNHSSVGADRFASIPCPVPAAAPAQHPLNDQT